MLLLPGLLTLLFVPSHPWPDALLAWGDWPGWVALLPVAVGLTWHLYRIAPAQMVHASMSGVLLLGLLLACLAQRWDDGGQWLGQHVLTAAWTLTAAGLLAVAWQTRQAPAASLAWVGAINTFLVLVALGGGATDPWRPAWPCALVLAASAQAAAAAVWTRRQLPVYLSGLLGCAVAWLAWVAWVQELPRVAGWEATAEARLAWLTVCALGAVSLLWTVLETGSRRSGGLLIESGFGPAFRHVGAWLALGVLAFQAAVGVLVDLATPGLAALDPAAWMAVAAALAAAAATLWDEAEERWALPWLQMYLIGLAAIGIVLHGLNLAAEQLAWAWVALVPAYVALAAGACWSGLRYPALGEEIGLRPRPAGWPLGWFAPVQACVAACCLPLALWAAGYFEHFGTRLVGAWAACWLAAAAVLLTPQAPRLLGGVRAATDVARVAALLLGTLACVLLHVSFVDPGEPGVWLRRTGLTAAALTWSAVVCGFVLPRLNVSSGGSTSKWGAVGRALATPLGALAACGMVLVLGQEFTLYDRAVGHTPLAVLEVIEIAAALAVLTALALTFAVAPALDLLRLSERRRTLYVYAAELLLVALLVHLRLNIPLAAHSPVARAIGGQWVFVVMAVAFAGVGVAELFQRRGLAVLSGPVQRTALFLPLLPLLAFLAHPLGEVRDRIESVAPGMTPFAHYLRNLPSDYRIHAVLWFLFGLLYLVVALTRRSSNLALVAAVLANFGLWVLFGHQDGLTFLVHPQLWLIPVGGIVLAAEALNRDRLTAAQSQALRYAGLLLIYISSTADMFIAGLGHSVVLPVALALLAVAGVLLGILLRVRAFLLLGVTFLFLVVFAQIWHAAVDRAQTWVWWASGIVLGAAILALFALFEKRREDVLRTIHEIKHWR